MKYVLVIDVPEPMESEDVKVDYLCYYHCGNIIENKIDVFPKPLPDKKPVSYHDDLFGDVEKNYTNIGWNDCLKELEK